MAKIVEAKNYDKEVYTKIEKQSLILFGIYLVSKRSGETCTFERLVKECFINFPEVFAFKRFPQWPDSSKFDRELRKLREKGLIVGRINDRFSLTEFGEEKAIQTKEILENKGVLNQKRKTSLGRSADDRLVAFLKESPQFRAFLKDPDNFSVSEPEFRNILRCTLETPKRVLNQNLEYYKNLANSYNERQLLEFLLFCERKFIKEGRMAKELPINSRIVEQLAKATVKNIADGIVELVTNCDDSYKRLEGKGQVTSGEMEICVNRKKGGACENLKVKDYAEGMTKEELQEAIVFGGETSGFEKGRSVRGLFGRGLKETIIALGEGEIKTIKNGKLCRTKLWFDKKPLFDDELLNELQRYFRKGWNRNKYKCNQ